MFLQALRPGLYLIDKYILSDAACTQIDKPVRTAGVPDKIRKIPRKSPSVQRIHDQPAQRLFAPHFLADIRGPFARVAVNDRQHAHVP
jgi:hypothetical protein